MITAHLHCKFPIAAKLWDVVDDENIDDDHDDDDGVYAVGDGGDHLAPSLHPCRAVGQPRSRLLALLGRISLWVFTRPILPDGPSL